MPNLYKFFIFVPKLKFLS